MIVEKGNVKREQEARAEEKGHQEPPHVKNAAEQVTRKLNVIKLWDFQILLEKAQEKALDHPLEKEKEKGKAMDLQVENGRVKVKVVIGWVLLK